MAEHNQVSIQEVRIFVFLEASPGLWLTNKAIAAANTEVAPRSVRAYTAKFVKLGLVDQAELFLGYQYRWSEKAAKRNRAYLQRLQEAAKIFGVTGASQNPGEHHLM